MGLDMHLVGRIKFKSHDSEESAFADTIGYWRKHSNLHGAIVNTFNDGVDDCSPIDLGEENINTLICMIKNNELPVTTGFFFGQSPVLGDQYYQTQFEKDIKIFNDALLFLKDTTDDEIYRWIQYRASW